MADENTHSLKVDIEADFGVTSKGIGEVADEFERMNATIEGLAYVMGMLKKNSGKIFSDFNSNIEKQLQEIAVQGYKIDGGTIQEKIQAALNSAMSMRKLEITGLEDGREKVSLRLSNQAKDNIKNKVIEQIANYANQVDIVGMDKLTVPIDGPFLQRIQDRFNTAMADAISNDVDFVLTNKQKINKFKLNSEHVNKMFDRVKDELQKYMDDPKFIQFEGRDKKLDPVIIHSDILEQAIKKVQDAVGNLDKNFDAGVIEKLNQLPPIKEKIQQFQRQTFALLEEVARSVDAISVYNPLDNSDRDKTYKNIQEAITEMRRHIVNFGTDVLTGINRRLEAEKLSFSGSDFELAAKGLAEMEVLIQAYVKSGTQAAVDALRSQLAIQKKTMDGKKVYAPSIRKIQELIVEASKEAIDNLDMSDLTIETAKVRQMFKDWANQTGDKLLANTGSELMKLQAELLAQNTAVTRKYIDALKELAEVNFVPVNPADGKKLNLQIDVNMEDIHKKVQEKMREVANTLIANVDFNGAAKKSLEAGLVLRKKDTDKIQSTVIEILRSQMDVLSEQMKNRSGIAFQEVHLEKFDKDLFSQSQKLINTMVEQANAISRSVSDGIDSKGLSALSAEEQVKVKEKFIGAAGKMLHDYTSMMDAALGSFTVSSVVMEEMKKQISTKMNEVLEKQKINFLDADKPLVLNDIVAQVQWELQRVIKANIEAWEPKLDAFNPNIDFKTLYASIEYVINKQLGEVAGGILNEFKNLETGGKKSPVQAEEVTKTLSVIRDGIMTYLRTYTDTVGDALKAADPGVMKPKDLSEAVKGFKGDVDNYLKAMLKVSDEFEPNVSIKAKDLHADVRKIFASQYKMLVKDWEKAHPTIDGSEGIKSVVENNIQAIMNKFHAVVNKEMKDAVKLYEDEMDKIKVTPNTEGVNLLARNLQQLQQNLMDKLSEYFNVQLELFSKGIKDFDPKASSIGYGKGAAEAAATKAPARPADYDNGNFPIEVKNQSIGYDREAIHKSDNDILSHLPANFESYNKWIRQRYIDIARAKNRFNGKLNLTDQDDFDKYIREFEQNMLQVGNTPLDKAGHVRADMVRLEQQFQHAMEVIRKNKQDQDMSNKDSNTTEATERQIQKFLQGVATLPDFAETNRGKVLTRFTGRLNEADMGLLQKDLDDYLARATEIQGRAIFDQEGLERAKLDLRDLNRELQRTSMIYGHLAKLEAQNDQSASMDYKIAKLKSSLNMLKGSTHVDAGRIGLFQAAIDGAEANGGLDFTKAKDMERELLRIHGQGVNDTNRARREAVREGKQVRKFAGTLPNFRTQANFNADNTMTRFLGRLGTQQYTDLETALAAYRNTAKAISERTITSAADMDQAKADMANLKIELKGIVSLYAQLARQESLNEQNRGMQYKIDKLKSSLQAFRAEGKVANTELQEFQRLIDEAGNGRTEFQKAKDFESYLRGVQHDAYRTDVDNQNFDFAHRKLKQEVDNFFKNSLLDADDVLTFKVDLDAASTKNDLRELRLQLDALRNKNRTLLSARSEQDSQREAERRRGNLLAQNQILQGNNTLMAEHISQILRAIPAYQGYTVTQMRVNNATNTWSASMRDADGNVRSLQGTIDRATGSLYQHSEALSEAIRQAERLGSISNQRYNPGNPMANYVNTRGVYSGEANEYNPNGDFLSSVVNTMRYMTAGAIMGAPSMAFYQAWEANKVFDMQMEKARQNFLIKDNSDAEKQAELTPDMRIMGSVAAERVDAAQSDLSGDARMEAIEAERKDLVRLSGGNDIRRLVENIAIINSIPIESAATSFHIASRLMDDPKQALAMTKSISKANAIEDLDIEKGSKGLEAVLSQWGLDAYSSNEVINMAIMAANKSVSTIEDTLDVQKRSGSIFRENLPGMNKRDAIATSIALGAMFSQSTARSGAEGGTFFKAILQRPFTAKGAEALTELSKQAGYEDLNPYTVDENGATRQKDFVSMFSSIMEHSMKMDDQSKKQLWASIFPQWHTGSAGAIEMFMKDMLTEMQDKMKNMQVDAVEADKNGDGQVNFEETMRWYINRTASSDDKAIAELHAGTSSTWDRQIQRLQTQSAASMRGMFDELKDEFGVLADFLTVVLRQIRDNAETLTATMALLSKIALGMGIKYAFNKGKERIDERNKKKQQEDMENVHKYLIAEKQAKVLTRMGAAEGFDIYGQQSGWLNDTKQRITTDKANAQSELGVARADLTNAENRKQALIASKQQNPSLDIRADLADANNDIANLNSRIARLTQTLQTLDAELNQVEQEEQDLNNKTGQLNDTMGEHDAKIRAVNARILALAEAMEDLGLDASKVRSSVNGLNDEFTSGAGQVNRYEQELQQLSQNAGMSDQQLGKLREEVEKMNKAFQEGRIDAMQYAQGMETIQRAHMTGTLGVAGGGVGANAAGQVGSGLLQNIIMGSMLSAAMAGPVKGVFQKIKTFRQTRDFKDLFRKEQPLTDPNSRAGEPLRDRQGKPILMSDIEAEDKVRTANKANYVDDLIKGEGTASKAGKLASAGRGLLGLGGTVGRMLPGVGQALLLGSLGVAAFKGSTAAGQTEGERLQSEMNSIIEVSKNLQSMKDGSLLEKAFGFSDFATKYLTDAAIGQFIGGKADFGDMHKAFGIMSSSSSGEEIAERMRTEFEIAKNQAKAKELIEEELALDGKAENENLDKSPFEDALDEMTNAMNNGTDAMTKLEETLGKVDEKMQTHLSMSNSDYIIESSRLLLNGVSQDSEQMRQLLQGHLERNNAILQSTLGEVSAEKAKYSDQSSEEYQKLTAREKDLQAQIAQNNVQMRQNKVSEFDAIMSKLQKELNKTEDEYGIQKDDAILAGASNDSPILKKIEAAKADASNGKIEEAQNELRELSSKLNLRENDPDYMRIQEAILDLEKQQKDNLVAIRSQMEKSKATFNLPSGVRPVSYMDHVMSNNTHRNVTTRMGDTVINMNISNMSGTQQDIDNVTNSLADAIRKANQQMANNFNRQVWNGMGAGYAQY